MVSNRHAQSGKKFPSLTPSSQQRSNKGTLHLLVLFSSYTINKGSFCVLFSGMFFTFLCFVGFGFGDFAA